MPPEFYTLLLLLGMLFACSWIVASSVEYTLDRISQKRYNRMRGWRNRNRK